MNGALLEFAKQAGLKGAELDNPALQSFAEMIIEECAHLANMAEDLYYHRPGEYVLFRFDLRDVS